MAAVVGDYAQVEDVIDDDPEAEDIPFDVITEPQPDEGGGGDVVSEAEPEPEAAPEPAETTETDRAAAPGPSEEGGPAADDALLEIPEYRRTMIAWLKWIPPNANRPFSAFTRPPRVFRVSPSRF